MTSMRKTRAPRRSLLARLVNLVGILCVVAGLGFLGYVGWQYFGTNVVAKKKQEKVTQQLIKNWDKGIDSKGVKGKVVDGDAVGLLRVARFGKDYEVPIVPGFDDAALASGIGSYRGGVGPGEVGNFALAGHRITHGEPFRDFLNLRKGDEVEVETRTRVFTYKLRDNGTDRVLDFTEGWVLDPVPGETGVKPTERMMTMLTCSELFHTDNRNVVFADLVDTQRKKNGRIVEK